MQPDNNFDDLENPYAAPDSSQIASVHGTAEEFGAEEFHPFKTIWLHPRRTVRSIVAVNPELHVVLLACLAGIGRSLDNASMRNAGERMSLAGILGSAIVVGSLSGLVSLWLLSHLIRFTGTWIGGTGLREDLKTAIAWASVPSVFALVLWVPQLFLFGSEMFTEEMPTLTAQPELLVPYLMILAAEFILAIWATVLLCNTVSEVQEYPSAWRGFGNLVLAVLLIAIPFIIIIAILVILR